VTKLSKAHRRWLKRLSTGKIPDHEWPIGVDSRGWLRTKMPALIVVPDEPPDRSRLLPLP
jgi:hypothetical protein